MSDTVPTPRVASDSAKPEHPPWCSRFHCEVRRHSGGFHRSAPTVLDEADVDQAEPLTRTAVWLCEEAEYGVTFVMIRATQTDALDLPDWVATLELSPTTARHLHVELGRLLGLADS